MNSDLTKTQVLARTTQKLFAEYAFDYYIVLTEEGKLDQLSSKFVEKTGKSDAELSEKLSQLGFFYEVTAEGTCTPLTQTLILNKLDEAGGLATSFLMELYDFRNEKFRLDCRLFKDPASRLIWITGSEHLSQPTSLLSGAIDPITGLLSGDSFYKQLEHYKEYTPDSFFVLSVNLCSFKRINEAFSKKGGDAILAEVGYRIRECIGQKDILGRMAADEYNLILTNSSEEDANSVAKRILATIQTPLYLEGSEIYVSANVGGTKSSLANSANELMFHASKALEEAKMEGLNKYRLYIKNTDAPNIKGIAEALTLESEMHRALRNGEFRVYYQPLVDAVSEKVKGCEALMRWIKPDGSMIPPSEFIPLAEKNGLISILGDYVLKTAIMQLNGFSAKGLNDLYVSINVSPKQLKNSDFFATLKKTLEFTKINPNRIVLEITEGVLVSNPEEMNNILTEVSKLGVSFSIDDFGTGYSCLAYLKTLPVHGLKVDKSFVNDIAFDPKSRSILNAIVMLAKAMGLKTIAEGVEYPEQSKVLSEAGVDTFQGYLYGKPVPYNEFVLKYADK